MLVVVVRGIVYALQYLKFDIDYLVASTFIRTTAILFFYLLEWQVFGVFALWA